MLSRQTRLIYLCINLVWISFYALYVQYSCIKENSYCVGILVWHRDGGRRSEPNQSVNSTIRSNEIYFIDVHFLVCYIMSIHIYAFIDISVLSNIYPLHFFVSSRCVVFYTVHVRWIFLGRGEQGSGATSRASHICARSTNILFTWSSKILHG
jgi:hypothetical protein